MKKINNLIIFKGEDSAAGKFVIDAGASSVINNYFIAAEDISVVLDAFEKAGIDLAKLQTETEK